MCFHTGFKKKKILKLIELQTINISLRRYLWKTFYLEPDSLQTLLCLVVIDVLRSTEYVFYTIGYLKNTGNHKNIFISWRIM